MNVGAIAGDGTVNIAERAAGFSISGDTGGEAGVGVTVTVGTETLTATSADESGTATWSVSVPGGAAYLTGTSVDVTVSASKTGFTAPADVQRTLTVDLTAPTAPSYTAPALLQVGEAIAELNPSGATDIEEYGAGGLPSGLEIDRSSGAITGTPDRANAATAAVQVRVEDAAGNAAEVDLVFPAVAKGEQTLVGFAYSEATVTYGSAAPTVTAPTGAVGALSYTAGPVAVCSAEPTGGALTIDGVGECEITVTAEGTDNYNEAIATYKVTVRAAGGAGVERRRDRRGRHGEHRRARGRVQHLGRHRGRGRCWGHGHRWHRDPDRHLGG